LFRLIAKEIFRHQNNTVWVQKEPMGKPWSNHGLERQRVDTYHVKEVYIKEKKQLLLEFEGKISYLSKFCE